MKKLRCLFCVLLALVLLLSLGAAALAESELQVSLGKMAGKLDEDEAELYWDVLTVQKGDKRALLDPFGKDKLGRGYDFFDPVDGYPELFVAKDYSMMPNTLSLVKTDGTVLAENAAMFRQSDGRGRYAVLSFATEEVEKEEDAFLISYGQEEAAESEEAGMKESFYAGYSLVYDLREERFVEGLRIDRTGDSFHFVGENILLDRMEWDAKDELYRPDGSFLAEVDDVNVNGDYFVIPGEGEACSVQDGDLKELVKLDFFPYQIYADATIFADKTDGGTYRLVNAAREPISELEFAYTPVEYGGFLYGEDEDYTDAVLTLSGETILGFDAQADNVYELMLGFLEIGYQDGSYALLYPNGTLVPLKEEIDTDLLSEVYESNEVFLVGRGVYQEMNGEVDQVAPLLISVENDEGLCGLYSLVDGKELLKQKYEEIEFAYGYVYALKDGVYEIYPVEIRS